MPRRRKTHVRWDVPRLLAVFGGVGPLLSAHHAAGFEPPLTYSAVASWQVRQRVPADRLAEILVLLTRTKGQLDINKFIVVEP